MSHSHSIITRAKFDVHKKRDSGTVDYSSFKLLLQDLGHHFSEAKTTHYFRFCDQDKHGEIHYEEFEFALFIFDKSLNPCAFNPGSIVRPRDAFNFFDKDSTGSLNEDEFLMALRYLGIDLNEETHVKLVGKYDKDESVHIQYPEFKNAWLDLVDPRKELLLRGIDVSTLSSIVQMSRLLDDALTQEDEREVIAIEKVTQWRIKKHEMNRRRLIFQNALNRYNLELSVSLDLNGQFYLFGGDIRNQTDKISHSCCDLNDEFDIDDENMLRLLWSRRLKHKRFDGVKINEISAFLWGKKPIDVAVTESYAFIICDEGQVYSWWRYYKPSEEENFTWTHQVIQLDDHNGCTQENIRSDVKAVDDMISSNDIDDYDKIKFVLEYFSKWKTPPRNSVAIKHAHSLLESGVHLEDLSLSAQLRSNNCRATNKKDLLEVLYHEIMLEKAHLTAHENTLLKELNHEIISLRTSKKYKSMKRKMRKFSEIRRIIPKELEHVKIHSKDDHPEYDSSVVNISKLVAVKAHSKRIGFLSDDGKLYQMDSFNTPLAQFDFDSMLKTMEKHFTEKIVDFSCGLHSAVIDSLGDLYVWEGASTSIRNLEIFSNNTSGVVRPSRVPIPSVRITQVSCGSGHIGCTTSEGNVYMWGSNAGYRLGLGDNIDRNEPTFVQNIADRTICDISCGYCQTMLITKIERVVYNENGSKDIKIIGGHLLVAGSANALGRKFKMFTEYENFSKHSELIDPVPIEQISAGFCHQAAVSVDGELFTFGDNTIGCSGHPEGNFIYIPTLVKCLNDVVSDVSIGKEINRSIPFFKQPFYEVDLGCNYTIDEIKLWNRVDTPINHAISKETFSYRLFPCWILISQLPFESPENDEDEGSLHTAIRMSIAKARLEENLKVSTWKPPVRTLGRYVRVQMERMEYLEIERLQVYGRSGIQDRIGKVHKAVCGNKVTSVILKQSDNEDDIELTKMRLEAFRRIRPWILPSDKMRCILCESYKPCELCVLKESMLHDGFTWEASDLKTLGQRYLECNHEQHFASESELYGS